MRPDIKTDAAACIGCDRSRCARISARRNPHIQHAIARGEIRKLFSIRAIAASLPRAALTDGLYFSLISGMRLLRTLFRRKELSRLELSLRKGIFL